MDWRKSWVPFNREQREREDRSARMVNALNPDSIYKWRHVIDVSEPTDIPRVVISAPGDQ